MGSMHGMFRNTGAVVTQTEASHSMHREHTCCADAAVLAAALVMAFLVGAALRGASTATTALWAQSGQPRRLP